MTRREALQLIGAGGSVARLLPLGSDRVAPQTAFTPDVEIALRAAPDEARILEGAPTRVWRFTGQVLRGPQSALDPGANSYLGPTIRLRRGQKVRIRFRNALGEPSIVHWHGLDVPAASDGHPRNVIDAGQEFVSEFEVTNRAGTYWYHPHPHHRTGPQVYRGLAGLLIISDPDEDALRLPAGESELRLVLQDRQFDDRNQLVYPEAGPASMMAMMHGVLGDRILVNGVPRPEFEVATRAYRIRILNGSNARVYKLAWSDGTAITQIGTDGGLLPAPIRRPFLTLGPAQRADLILDLSGRAVGSVLSLESRAYPVADVDMAMGGMAGGRGMGMGRGMDAGASGASAGAPSSLAVFRLSRRDTSAFRLPAALAPLGPGSAADPAAPVRRVPISFAAGAWLLDGRTFAMDDVAPAETVKAGSTHVWEFVNEHGMMGRPMAHPIHLHGRQFRVLSRTSAPGTPISSLRSGIVDDGWTDTMLVLPGDTVRIQVTFSRHPGLYLYHCHLLEHEDMGMMRNFRIT